VCLATKRVFRGPSVDLPRTATRERLEVGVSNVAKEHIRVCTFQLLPKVVRGRE
jgi:hypothetical protein